MLQKNLYLEGDNAKKVMSEMGLKLDEKIKLTAWGENVDNARLIGLVFDRVTRKVIKVIFEYDSKEGRRKAYVYPYKVERSGEEHIIHDFTEVNPNFLSGKGVYT